MTFYPSSLMLSDNVKPLIFFSEATLMYFTTKLKAMSFGPVLKFDNNCSIPQNDFFSALLH